MAGGICIVFVCISITYDAVGYVNALGFAASGDDDVPDGITAEARRLRVIS